MTNLHTVSTVFPATEWEHRKPETLGLNTDALDRIGAGMKASSANGVLIYKGCLTAEWSFGGPETKRYEVQSVTKSITTLVLGLALREQLIPSLDTRVKSCRIWRSDSKTDVWPDWSPAVTGRNGRHGIWPESAGCMQTRGTGTGNPYWIPTMSRLA